MHGNQKYPWDRLLRQGDFVVVPGVEARQVSTLARFAVEATLGPGVVVVAKTTPAGAFVAVAYVPTESARGLARTVPSLESWPLDEDEEDELDPSLEGVAGPRGDEES